MHLCIELLSISNIKASVDTIVSRQRVSKEKLVLYIWAIINSVEPYWICHISYRPTCVVGKTMVARILGKLFFMVGILPTDQGIWWFCLSLYWIIYMMVSILDHLYDDFVLVYMCDYCHYYVSFVLVYKGFNNSYNAFCNL